jgi:hypothetical protein
MVVELFFGAFAVLGGKFVFKFQIENALHVSWYMTSDRKLFTLDCTRTMGGKKAARRLRTMNKRRRECLDELLAELFLLLFQFSTWSIIPRNRFNTHVIQTAIIAQTFAVIICVSCFVSAYARITVMCASMYLCMYLVIILHSYVVYAI